MIETIGFWQALTGISFVTSLLWMTAFASVLYARRTRRGGAL